MTAATRLDLSPRQVELWRMLRAGWVPVQVLAIGLYGTCDADEVHATRVHLFHLRQKVAGTRWRLESRTGHGLYRVVGPVSDVGCPLCGHALRDQAGVA